MTEADVIAHWRKGAKDALEMAQLACDAGKYDHALFNCHLAVEKALKVQYMTELRQEAPYTHDLFFLARKLSHVWTKEQEKQFAYLTEYAVAARYDNPQWAQQEATKENSLRWIAVSTALVSSLIP
ncbi:MAG TPA: HEPN domain-containing protein [Candidatus Peribacteraceae bacterium]|nr:HEPN domain-containing protein [Candidatus Peribacteraceae bacterium]